MHRTVLRKTSKKKSNDFKNILSRFNHGQRLHSFNNYTTFHSVSGISCSISKITYSNPRIKTLYKCIKYVL